MVIHIITSGNMGWSACGGQDIGHVVAEAFSTLPTLVIPQVVALPGMIEQSVILSLFTNFSLCVVSSQPLNSGAVD